jgi:tRNA pseudouridine13 synthase
MKIKVKPEDFVVLEISSVRLSRIPGAYRVYKLFKRQWDTFDLLDFLSFKLGVPKADIAVSGIKDRYGDTSQLVSIKTGTGLPHQLEEKNFTLTHAGYTDEKLRAADIEGNRFTIVLRDIPYYQLDLILQSCEQAKQQGFPNYFDEQRFGSARAGQGFMGKALFLGQMEEALKIYLAPSKHDRREEKAFKTDMTDNWRRWEKVTVPAPRKYQGIFETLTAFGKWEAFTRAVNAIDRDMLVMALHGYQSYLFNRIVYHYLSSLQQTDADIRLEKLAFKYGYLLFYKILSEPVFGKMSTLLLPVPGHDTQTTDPVVEQALRAALDEEHISLGDLKVKKLPGKAVRGVERALIAVPEEFRVNTPANDECYPGRYKIGLEFSLPRGTYATMLVKRISLGTR